MLAIPYVHVVEMGWVQDVQVSIKVKLLNDAYSLYNKLYKDQLLLVAESEVHAFFIVPTK